MPKKYRLLLLPVMFLMIGCNYDKQPNQSRTEQESSNFLSDNKLQYHGYFYKNDVLENSEELKEIRKFANMLVFSTIKLDSITPQMVRNYIDGDLNAIGDKGLKDIGRRIDLLESMDYITVGEFPIGLIVQYGTFEGYKKFLRDLKERVPQFAKLDYLYFWDEPDINFIPGPDVLEKYIEEYKLVFPGTKITTCYAIPAEGFADAIPPKNVDLLMIDPYFFTDETGENTPANFEKYYRERLALILDWINKWDMPYLMVGDAFGSITDEGKRFPSYEVSMWYYILAMTQESCNGLLWFQYGYLETPEMITGVSINDEDSTLISLHKNIGDRIFGAPSVLGLPMEKKEPHVHEIIKQALELNSVK
ncbi:MAG: hypothetical protein ABFS32_07955 [Bacteroidota bacterium]